MSCCVAKGAHLFDTFVLFVVQTGMERASRKSGDIIHREYGREKKSTLPSVGGGSPNTGGVFCALRARDVRSRKNSIPKIPSKERKKCLE